MLERISSFRILDSKFQERVATRKVYTHEKHFFEKCIEDTSEYLLHIVKNVLREGCIKIS